MTQHPIFSDDLKEIVDSFVIETQEIFEELDNELLLLEKHAHDIELVDRIFRAVHTVKGTAGFLSLEQIGKLSHHFEDVLNRLRKGQFDFQPAMMDVLFTAFDLMKVLLQQVIDQQLEEVDMTVVLAELQAISEGTFTGSARTTPEPEASIPAVAEQDESLPTPGTEPLETYQAALAATRVTDRETIRVEVRRLDNLMDLVGELVLGRNRLLQLVSDVGTTSSKEEILRELNDTSAQVDFVTTELQTAVMHTRMIQIGRVFNKFPRVIRDLAREFEKEIDLEIEGQDTEVDKSLIEEISDPLVHLIRNAADHAIERPTVREQKGKPRRGKIRLTAAHKGNNIIITVEDDGAGMDAEKFKSIALSKNMITPKEAAEMTDEEAYRLIFMPGFSTAHQLSQVSGRGVGMDVVKTNIARLNGTIEITSHPGQGTHFTLKMPLTLVIIQSLLVRLGEETFALPLHTVIEVVSLQNHEVQTIHGQKVTRLREEVVPLVHVGEMLNVKSPPSGNNRTYAVIVGVAHYRLGLIVDGLIGQKEIVIKPLGALLKKTRGIAGSTILGDGRVIMILDVGELVYMVNESRHLSEGHQEAA